eukprot:11186144-Lingulodinium_polyedra.AAC.1
MQRVARRWPCVALRSVGHALPCARSMQWVTVSMLIWRLSLRARGAPVARGAPASATPNRKDPRAGRRVWACLNLR